MATDMINKQAIGLSSGSNSGNMKTETVFNKEIDAVKAKNASILVVEDERITSEHLSRTLIKLGYRVAGAAVSGPDAINLALSKQPDLILMDIMLKGPMNGIEAARQIHEGKDIPVIYLTAYADDNTLSNAKETIPYGYILKPFEERELHSNIEIALYKHQAESRIKRSEEKYRILTENAVSGIFTIRDGKILYSNTSASLLTGYTNEELAKTIFFEIVDPDFRDLIKKTFSELIAGNRTHSRFGLRFSPRDGESRWMDLNVLMIEYKDGPALLCECHDITEQKHAKDKIEQSIKKMNRVMDGIIHAIAYTLETRDPYTAGHQRRVGTLARKVATALGLHEDIVECIYTAGVIHDIGKISVPAEILSKPGKLTKSEFDLIKMHSQVGFDILNRIDFPWPISKIVYQHHERIDGSGYPEGIKNDDIRIEAQIISIADVVEAISSHRPYRAALGIDKAIEEITNNRGKLYRNDIVESCLAVITNKDFTLNDE